MHESSANEIYSRRQEEIRRKIEILKKKRELTNSELKSWQEKSYKLKLEPDIIEIDPYEEERARREKLKSFPKNYHKIPGLKLDDLSFEYTNGLKIKWTERLENVEGIKKNNFLDKTELVELENKLGELKNSCSETEKSILVETEKSNKLKNLLAKIRSKSQTSLNKKLSDHRIGQTPTDCEETSEEDSLLLKFWELLHEENHVSNLKAVTLALTNRKFHVAGTLAIFSEHDFKTMKLDVYEMSVNRSFNPRSTAYQFASGLDKIINYGSTDTTIHSDLTDGIIEILRENGREKHIKRASLNCARMLSLTGDTNDRTLASKIYLAHEDFDNYIKNGGCDLDLILETPVFKTIKENSWRTLITKKQDLNSLVSIFNILISEEVPINISVCNALEQVNQNLRTKLVSEFGGWRIFVEAEETDFDDTAMQSEHIELKAILVCRRAIKKALSVFNEIERSQFEFYF